MILSAHQPHPGAAIGAAEGMRFKALIASFTFLAFLLLLVPALRAQENATINGSVTDASGAVVANAQLTLTNTATGQIRNEVSNSVGAYRFGNVGIGSYTLDAAAPGFQKYTKTGIVVNVAQTLEEDVQFKVGSASPDRLRPGRSAADSDRNQRSQHAHQRSAGRRAFYQRQQRDGAGSAWPGRFQ